MTRPIVLVVGRWSEQVNTGTRGVYLQRTLIDAVVAAGGEPVLVWPGDAERAGRLVAMADAVILPGGNDLDLRPYGIAEVHPEETHSPPEQDAADVTTTRAALQAGLPMLAICRGMQVLNIVLGGTIHQHVTETTVAHRTGEHPVQVVPGTHTARLLGVTQLSGYSSHHQACDRLAAGLVLSATSADGLIEGFESTDGRIVGTQWHPEVTAAEDPLNQKPFDWLVHAALAGVP